MLRRQRRAAPSGVDLKSALDIIAVVAKLRVERDKATRERDAALIEVERFQREAENERRMRDRDWIQWHVAERIGEYRGRAQRAERQLAHLELGVDDVLAAVRAQGSLTIAPDSPYFLRLISARKHPDAEVLDG